MSRVHIDVGDHVMLFYESDADLITTVGAHLLEGLENGELALVIATAEHRRALTTEFTEAGLDVAEAKRCGQLVELDAAATLSSLTRDGCVDRGLFNEVVGQVVGDALSTGRPIRAFGEMVTLLWEAGDLLGAMKLETLWNELRTELPFSLVCAYPSQSDLGAGPTDPLTDVCDLHTRALSSDGADFGIRIDEVPNLRVTAREVTARFQATVDAPAAARHLLVEGLTSWGHDDHLVSDALIVISELTGNAVLHVGRPFLVKISDDGEYVRIAVSDPDTSSSVDYNRGPLAQSGRGLWLVHAIAHSWGVNVASGHKTVWADLRVLEEGE